VKRRTFLKGALASFGALGLSRLVRGDIPRAPLRLLIIHKPNGTIPAAYDTILEPFADLSASMVVVEGLDIKKKPNTPGEDHGNGMVTFTTGGITFRADASSVPLAERASIDQLLAREPAIVGDAPIRSLQLAADVRSAALFTRTLSYAGRGAPIPSVQNPQAAFTRVFGSLAAPGGDPTTVRMRKQSVLDFAAADLQRVTGSLVGAERERLDRHLEAIREVERLLDRSAGFDSSTVAQQVLAIDNAQLDAQHGEIGAAHFAIVRAAFQCDLTRIVTFGWASGQSQLNFSRLLPGVENLGYHDITHMGTHVDQDGTAVHRWYNERMAEMLRTLRDTPDLDGRTLLDNTLVVVWSEMRTAPNHTFDSVPIQLFGGGLIGGRRLVYANRPTNDLWLTIANHLGHPMTCFGDAERCTGPLPDLFGSM